ncbi:MAG: hypothetical protein ABI243_07040 [Lapillicoccus sp.]
MAEPALRAQSGGVGHALRWLTLTGEGLGGDLSPHAHVVRVTRPPTRHIGRDSPATMGGWVSNERR